MGNNALPFYFETCLQKIKPSSQPQSELWVPCTTGQVLIPFMAVAVEQLTLA